MANKLGQTGLILRTLGTAYSSLTFGEICTKLNESKDSIRKALHYLHKEGRIARANDSNGITHYNLTEKGKAWVDSNIGETSSSQAEVENTSVIKASVKPVWKESIPKKEPWEQLVAEAEQRGFAKGYAAASETYQRQAYEEGKASVVKKLAELLT